MDTRASWRRYPRMTLRYQHVRHYRRVREPDARPGGGEISVP
jgi:hypothetical protein